MNDVVIMNFMWLIDRRHCMDYKYSQIKLRTMNRKSLMSSGLDNESTRNKLKELALYDSETNETVVLCQDLVQVKMRNFSPF